jgi:hypothetical protein
VFLEGNGPDLTPRYDIRIRDTAPAILRCRSMLRVMGRALC